MLARKIAFVIAAVSTALAQDSADPVQSIVSDLRARRYSEANATLEEALKKSPDDVRLWTLNGFALLHLGNPQRALASYEHALDLSPEYLPALEGAAEIEFKASDQRAVVLLARILKTHPDDQTSHAMLASLAFTRGDCNEATKEFGSSRSLIDSQPAALRQYGSCLIKLGRAVDAIPIFQRLIEIEPDKEKARYNLAVVQSLAGHYQDVIAILSASSAKNGENADVLDLLAEAYEKTSNTPQAVATLRQAILTQPYAPRYYLDFANICLSHGSFQVGIDMLNAGLKRIPEQAELYLARGILYIQLGQDDQAEDDFAQAERLNPNVPFGSAAQGLAKLQRNKLNEAESTIRSRLRTKPNDAFLQYLLAETLQRQGAAPGTPQFQEAVKSAERAIQLQPRFTLARDVLSRLYLQENKVDEAIEQSRRAFEGDPTDQTALYHYILALRRRNNSEDVSQLTERLAQLREQARAKEAAEHKYALVEVKPQQKPASEGKP